MATGETDLKGRKSEVVATSETDLEARQELRKWERLLWWKEERGTAAVVLREKKDTDGRK